MPVIELDMLIALVNKSDKLHKVASGLFQAITSGRLKEMKLASSALLEYELVLRSRGYSEKDIRGDIEAFKLIPNLKEAFLTSEVIVKASSLREKYSLTYFDSLHCATAMLYDGKIVASDNAYDNVPEVRRLDPSYLI